MITNRVELSDSGKALDSPKARDATADLLKGTAVVLMTQVHLMELFAQPDVLSGPAGQVSLFCGGPPAAPVFMLVMGYFVAASTRSMIGLLLRGLKLLALGGLLNLGLNAHLLLKIKQGVLPLDPWPYILGVDILFVAGAGTMLLAVLRPLLRRSVLAPFVAALVVILLTPWMTGMLTTTGRAQWAFAYVAGAYAWSYFPWFPWLAYPLLGFGWYQVQLRYACRLGFSPPLLEGGLKPTLHSNPGIVVRRWRLVLAVLAAGCAVGTAMTWDFGVTVSDDLPQYYHHDWRFFLWVSAFLAAWVGLHRLCEWWFGMAAPLRWLEFLGRHVTLCYVIQWLLIGNIATVLYKSETLLHWGLWVVVMVTATTLLARLLVFVRCVSVSVWHAFRTRFLA